MRLAVHQPLVESLERDPAPGPVAEQRIVRLERRIAVRHHEQSRPGAVQAGDLHVTCITADVRIGERVHGVRFVERAIREDVVEDQGYPQGADFHRLVRHVAKLESERELLSTDLPIPSHREGKVGRHSWRQVGGRQLGR